MTFLRIHAPSLVVAAAAIAASALAACSSSTPAGASSGGVADASASTQADGAATSLPSDAGNPSTADDAASYSLPDGGDAGPDLDMQASDFACILGWTKVGDYRVTNMLGDLPATLAVASAPDGGVFPVGTVVQLIPNEAMVKRHTGFDPATLDWEFFNLTTSATGTVINQRGGASVTNFTGSSCANCHGAAAPQWDMICGTTHGCAPLPIDEATIQSIQNGDPRCVDGG